MMEYIRQILLNEPNLDLRYVYFNILMTDGLTPALGETGGQPEANITNTGWSSIDIGKLETVGFGRYRALLSDDAVNQLGVILTRYIGSNIFECFGESIEVIPDNRLINIFDDSNSPIINMYLTINEAENYFSTRMKSDDWVEASPEDKIKSLITATRDIENLAFSGWKTTGSQPLEWPRNGRNTIPQQIKAATCEIAITYLSGYDEQLEIETLRINREEFFSVKNIYDITITEEAKRAGINNERAWRLLKPYLRDPRLMRVIRSS